MPEKADVDTEKVVGFITEAQPAIIIDKIRKETEKDPTLQKLSEIIKTGDWSKHKKDINIAPFIPIKDELYEAEGLILRMSRIILPAKLQKKVIQVAHEMGHFGKTKTKQMLRAKYWFPTMNTMIDNEIERCFECQITTRQHTEEPIKPTTIPQRPWEEIAIDFAGPFPDGHYNLVAIDKRTR